MKEGALHELPGGWVWKRLEDVMDCEFIKSQINAGERRFVNLNIWHLSEVGKNFKYFRRSRIKK